MLVLNPVYAASLNASLGLSQQSGFELREGSAPLDQLIEAAANDEQLLADWLHPNESTKNVGLASQLQDEEVYAVRRYDDGRGRKVVVYSQVVGEQELVPVIY